MSLLCRAAAFLALLVFAAPALAAEGEAFESLTIGVQFNANVNRNEFHDYWQPAHGGDVYLETPFDFGVFRVGARGLWMPAEAGDVPDFTGVFGYAGWGQAFSPHHRLRAFIGFDVGSNLMVFAGEENVKEKYEMEVAADLVSRLGYRLSTDWSLTASATCMVTMTARDIKLWFVSVGVARSFTMPSAVKRFLQ